MKDIEKDWIENNPNIDDVVDAFHPVVREALVSPRYVHLLIMTKEFVGVGGVGVTEERDVVKELPL